MPKRNQEVYRVQATASAHAPRREIASDIESYALAVTIAANVSELPCVRETNIYKYPYPFTDADLLMIRYINGQRVLERDFL